MEQGQPAKRKNHVDLKTTLSVLLWLDFSAVNAQHSCIEKYNTTDNSWVEWYKKQIIQ